MEWTLFHEADLRKAYANEMDDEWGKVGSDTHKMKTYKYK